MKIELQEKIDALIAEIAKSIDRNETSALEAVSYALTSYRSYERSLPFPLLGAICSIVGTNKEM